MQNYLLQKVHDSLSILSFICYINATPDKRQAYLKYSDSQVWESTVDPDQT